MISFFRSFFQSKIGLVITFAFVGLIAIAFASADVTGSGTFGGIGDAGKVASIDGAEIGSAELVKAVSSNYDQVRQENPTLDMISFVDQGGMESVLQQMINGYALQVFGQQNGMVISKRLVDSEIAGIPAFRGANGQFDETIFRRALQQQGLTERGLREEIRRGMMADQLLTPASLGTRLTDRLVAPYANLTLEGREGEIAFVPSSAFLPDTKPTDKALKAYYDSNVAKYRIPETRTIKYATFQDAKFRGSVEVSDAEIAELYESRRVEYAAKESRDLAQVIVPTQAAAQALAASVKAGKTLEAAASDVGLSVANIDAATRSQFSGSTSKAVADAVFSAREGQLAKIAQSGLGWHVVRIRDIVQTPTRTLASVRTQLVDEIREEKIRESVAQFTEDIEDRFADGATLEEVAEAEGLEVKTSPPLNANGRAPGDPNFTPVGPFRVMLPTAFALEEDSSAQLAEVQPGTEYVMFNVDKITPSAPPQLASIRAEVERDYMLAQGSKAAKQLADKTAKSAKSIEDIIKSIRAADIGPPQVERIGTTRQELTANRQRVPPPVALLFSMAPGTTKVLEAPGEQGWFIVHLRKINQGNAPKDAKIFIDSAKQLSQVAGNEYRQQFLAAIKRDMKIERNDSAIKAVADQVTGRNRDN